ncbi:hypothetical protein [Streptomyces tuirus]|uniref:Uncharacterized protein n=1 Tax=Streptomyces tuirus TaxID=68278 RepID=A0A7G1NMX5_9ACTN|nr:hypothetical protein GCM10017668_55850 [Streptomyces tuirus]
MDGHGLRRRQALLSPAGSLAGAPGRVRPAGLVGPGFGEIDAEPLRAAIPVGALAAA